MYFATALQRVVMPVSIIARLGNIRFHIIKVSNTRSHESNKEVYSCQIQAASSLGVSPSCPRGCRMTHTARQPWVTDRPNPARAAHFITHEHLELPISADGTAPGTLIGPMRSRVAGASEPDAGNQLRTKSTDESEANLTFQHHRAIETRGF